MRFIQMSDDAHWPPVTPLHSRKLLFYPNPTFSYLIFFLSFFSCHSVLKAVTTGSLVQLNLYLRSRPSVRSSESLPRSDASNDDDCCLNFAESLVLEELASSETSSCQETLAAAAAAAACGSVSARRTSPHATYLSRVSPEGGANLSGDTECRTFR